MSIVEPFKSIKDFKIDDKLQLKSIDSLSRLDKAEINFYVFIQNNDDELDFMPNRTSKSDILLVTLRIKYSTNKKPVFVDVTSKISKILIQF